MSESPNGIVRSERHGHILKVVIDNPAKHNAFHPQMMEQLSEAFTLLDRDEQLWVGVLCAEGRHFTAGLDMPQARASLWAVWAFALAATTALWVFA